MTIRKLQSAPGECDFYQAVYAIERQLGLEERYWQYVGQDGFPANELIRFKSDQHLGFPGQPISKIELKPEVSKGKTTVNMRVNFMGLTGPSGVLPRHYTELLLQRIKQHDTAMRDFFDLFHHRLVSLYYRAWKKYRMPCHYEQGGRENKDTFSQVLAALVGGDDPLKTYYGGLFNKQNRSAEGLRHLLGDFIGCTVDIEQLEGRWIGLADTDQTRLTSRTQPEGQYARLGQEATLGNRVWDISSMVKVILRPAQSALVKRLLPGSDLLRRVNALINDYVGEVIQTKIVLRAHVNDLPDAYLGNPIQKLGQNIRLSLGQESQNKSISI